MTQAPLRRRMRSEDAMFLYLERKEMPLHIGSVSLLDGELGDGLETLIEARLPEIPRYRQRAIFSPLNLNHPTWEFDPAFDIRNHIRRVRLAAPGTEVQLSELSGRVFTELMDRGKPLWDITVVDGLEGNRSALITRVHHCLVDGVSGTGLMNILLDTGPVPRSPITAEAFAPPPLPDKGAVLVEGLAASWAETVERVLDANVKFLRLAQSLVWDASASSLRKLLSIAPELIRPNERLPFNKPCSGERGHCWASISFQEARAIRAAVGGTINDAVLAAVTGAISRYAVAHREGIKGRFARIMVPVNLRTEDPRGDTGNVVSMLPMSMPLDISDPLERMRAVTLRTTAMKEARVADIVALFATLAGATPAFLQGSLSALPFIVPPLPLLNIVCTNVPGPMVPLYANGRELLTYYPHVPVGTDMGLGVAIQSYNQRLYFGITSDRQAAPDGELFRDLIVECYEELRTEAGVPAMPPVRARARAARTNVA